MKTKEIEAQKATTYNVGTASGRLTGVQTQGSVAPQQPREAGRMAQSLLQMREVRLQAQHLLKYIYFTADF